MTTMCNLPDFPGRAADLYPGSFVKRICVAIKIESARAKKKLLINRACVVKQAQ